MSNMLQSLKLKRKITNIEEKCSLLASLLSQQNGGVGFECNDVKMLMWKVQHFRMAGTQTTYRHKNKRKTEVTVLYKALLLLHNGGNPEKNLLFPLALLHCSSKLVLKKMDTCTSRRGIYIFTVCLTSSFAPFGRSGHLTHTHKFK